MARWIILDIATAPIDGCEAFLDAEDISAPSNWKDPDKIAAYQAEKRRERIERAGLDVDLARVTGIGYRVDGAPSAGVNLAPSEEAERQAFINAAASLRRHENVRIVTYNGHGFDLLLLQRRARYLGVSFPTINTDRYRSPHVDLMDVLTYRGLLARKPLAWYARRHGWTDLSKPLSGAEEAQVPQTGKWNELRQSIAHDVELTRRLACWLGVIEDVAQPVEAQGALL